MVLNDLKELLINNRVDIVLENGDYEGFEHNFKKDEEGNRVFLNKDNADMYTTYGKRVISGLESDYDYLDEESITNIYIKSED